MDVASRKLVSYIAPAAPATRRPATGDEPFLRPEIGFTPRWYRQTLDFDFGEHWHTDPSYRLYAAAAMRRELDYRFRNVGIGVGGRQDGPPDLLTGVFGGCLVAGIYGVPIRYSPDNWPVCEARYLTAEQVDRLEPPDLGSNIFFCELIGQLDRIAREFGRVEGYLNWQGVLNNAYRLRGEDLFADMLLEPRRALHLFECVATTMMEGAGRVYAYQRPTGVDVRHFTVSNCLVNMVSPEQYGDLLLPLDRRIAEEFGLIGIHNCAWNANPYLEHYATVPNMGYIDMGIESDLKTARRLFPDARRAIMYTPMDLANKAIGQIEADFERIARECGPCDIVLADIDAGTPDERVLQAVEMCVQIGSGVQGSGFGVQEPGGRAMRLSIFDIAFATACIAATSAAEMPQGKTHTNSIGMQFVRIEAGSFEMGVGKTPLPSRLAGMQFRREGDFDEKPVHTVRISKPFYMGTCEVTNAQYEQFEPAHRQLRGKLDFSKGDNEAVVFVTWHDAVRFCEWLSKKEGLPYRLPTEAEWEYACRAGTTTHFWTGDELPKAFEKNQRRSWFPDPVRSGAPQTIDLTVGKTPPNPWGLCDMHGNVEEWCQDWYGPYEAGEQADPVGRASGDFRVTRGGSHSTEVYYLRSANRMGTVPEDRSWLIGFRVVLGEMPKSQPLPAAPPSAYQRNVSRRPQDLTKAPDPNKPHFKGPRKYVKIPPGSDGPMFSHHNHDPAICECPNGDLLAIWYTCVEESGRELAQLASRLRYGQEEWDEASPFWDAPDRNDHAPALWFDGKDTIYHFAGLSAAATWGNLATILRTSTDNGATWSTARLIVPEHGPRHMPVESVFRTREGYIILPCDAVTGGNGGTAIHVSRDQGRTWEDAGGKTAGIHAGVVQLSDGRLLAFGRGDEIDGLMAKSISADMGRTWTCSQSDFDPIGGGQRLVLMRLKEGPLFFASFARRMKIVDASGKEHPVSGLFGALSFDEGETWPVRRLISDDGPGRKVETTDGVLFIIGASTAEPRGYLSVCQSADGVIHLISSRQHYAFNLAWLKTPPL